MAYVLNLSQSIQNQGMQNGNGGYPAAFEFMPQSPSNFQMNMLQQQHQQKPQQQKQQKQQKHKQQQQQRQQQQQQLQHQQQQQMRLQQQMQQKMQQNEIDNPEKEGPVSAAWRRRQRR